MDHKENRVDVLTLDITQIEPHRSSKDSFFMKSK